VGRVSSDKGLVPDIEDETALWLTLDVMDGDDAPEDVARVVGALCAHLAIRLSARIDKLECAEMADAWQAFADAHGHVTETRRLELSDEALESLRSVTRRCEAMASMLGDEGMDA
jgi:2-keto-4-pentenoate hydratase